MLRGDAGNLTIWALMQRIVSFRWVLIQAGAAALLAALRGLPVWAVRVPNLPREPTGLRNTRWPSEPCWREPTPHPKPASYSTATIAGDTLERRELSRRGLPARTPIPEPKATRPPRLPHSPNFLAEGDS